MKTLLKKDLKKGHLYVDLVSNRPALIVEIEEIEVGEADYKGEKLPTEISVKAIECLGESMVAIEVYDGQMEEIKTSNCK